MEDTISETDINLFNALRNPLTANMVTLEMVQEVSGRATNNAYSDSDSSCSERIEDITYDTPPNVVTSKSTPAHVKQVDPQSSEDEDEPSIAASAAPTRENTAAALDDDSDDGSGTETIVEDPLDVASTFLPAHQTTGDDAVHEAYSSNRMADSSHVEQAPLPTRSKETASASGKARNTDSSRLPKIPHGFNEEEECILGKQQVLLDLERLRQSGVRLTRDYTLRDNIADMEFELRRHLIHRDELDKVENMKRVMIILCERVEALSKLVPFINLDGWSQMMCTKEIHKYDHTLSRLYRKYMYGVTTSPEAELATGIVLSMVVYSIGQRMKANIPMQGGGRAWNASGGSSSGIGDLFGASNRSAAGPNAPWNEFIEEEEAVPP